MGRWTQQDATVCIFGTVNCAFGENTSDARRIVNAHNADCDAYEKRIAELEAKLSEAVAEAIWEADTRRDDAAAHAAELARVKAESLRVVPTEQHELSHWEVAMAVFVGGATTIYERYDSEDGKLVRLERWKTEE